MVVLKNRVVATSHGPQLGLQNALPLARTVTGAPEVTGAQEAVGFGAFLESGLQVGGVCVEDELRPFAVWVWVWVLTRAARLTGEQRGESHGAPPWSVETSSRGQSRGRVGKASGSG
jgi:hypothetical protein